VEKLPGEVKLLVHLAKAVKNVHVKVVLLFRILLQLRNAPQVGASRKSSREYRGMTDHAV
jgi:hypothetical protein